MADFNDFSGAKLMAGTLGSLVSMKFVQGTYLERLLMCVGGSALSYYGTTPIYQWIAVENIEGLVGFMVGLFGMAIVAKLYEAIHVIEAEQLMNEVWERFKRKWGA